jgi:hypothetical protein
MSFLKPLMLAALAGALVPILIHLIHKRRPRKQKFAAIELVLRSVERVERRWRIKRFLLLAARVTLLSALALAAAGPLVGGEESLTIAGRGPERVAIVIDASLSMRAAYGGSSAFVRAIAEARNIVDRLGPEDQAVIVAAERRPRLLVDRPTASKQKLLEAIDELDAGYSAASVAEAVSDGAAALASLSEEGKSTPEEPFSTRVVLITDLAQPSFEGTADLGRADLEIIDVLEGVRAANRRNRAITALEGANVPAQKPRTVELRARVQVFAPEAEREAAPADLTLRSGDEDLYEGSVELVSGTIVDKVIRHAFDRAGYIPVELSLERDVLQEDDVRYATVDVRRQVRILIVDGAPSGVPKEDEVFYLDRALAAGAADQPAPRVITSDDLPRADFAAFDVVIMAGVASFSRSDGARLVEFVEKGGGLIISTAEDLDAELYNSELGRILPRPLRLLKIVAPELLPARSGLVRAAAVGSRGVVTLANPLLEHPTMEIFRGEALSGLLSTRTSAYMNLQPGAQQAMAVILEHDDGQPAIVERSAGRGRVVFLTTSIDRDLTDLPIRPAFVPLMRQLILYAGNALSKPDPRRTLVGDTREIIAPRGATRIVVKAPDGSEQIFEASELGDAIRYPRTDVPGHYEVRAAFAGPVESLESESFAVNVDTRESDLRPISADEARAILTGQADPATARTALAAARALGNMSPEALATLLLLAMVIAFVAESLLTAQRIGR